MGQNSIRGVLRKAHNFRIRSGAQGFGVYDDSTYFGRLFISKRA